MRVTKNSSIYLLAKQESGFTLIEVIIALGIVGALMSTLLYTLQFHIEVASQQHDLAIATSLAYATLEEKLQLGVSESSSKNGTLGEDFKYSYDVSESVHDGLYEIRLVVTGRGQEVRLNAFYPK